MLINAWVEIRDDFDFERADNVETLARCGDIEVIPGLFKGRTQGPRSWQLYSLIYDVATERDFERAIERFKSENPGQTDVLGAWNMEHGGQVGMSFDGFVDVPNPDYVGEPLEIPNPDYQPDPELPDYDPREFIPNPDWVPEFLQEPVYSGVPLYPIPGRLSDFMPDDDPTLRDVNVYYGQTFRDFG